MTSAAKALWELLWLSFLISLLSVVGGFVAHLYVQLVVAGWRFVG
jgi:hypothetical protein